MAELKIISMDEVQSKEVNWLWYPYIPYGKITIIQGDPGEGKTTLPVKSAFALLLTRVTEPRKNYLFLHRSPSGIHHIHTAVLVVGRHH